ncbi:MAG: LPS-assembly protein LptD [Gammaproteobacteria bacterium]|nr:LPS-assembly protein LptD [Gammaproteobacteria bacterium]
MRKVSMPDFMSQQPLLNVRQRVVVTSMFNRVARRFAQAVPAVMLLLLSAPANAACKGRDCVCVPSEIQFASPVMQPGENGKFPISLEADDVEAQGEELVILKGNAEVSQGRQTIVADELKYYRETDRVVASGNVEMVSESGNYLASESIDVHAPTQIGTLLNTEFKIARSISSEGGIDTVQLDSRGSADVVDLEGEGLIRLKNARYTNCDEGNDDVIISAGNLVLDQTAGVGKARNAVVRFQGLPIFYAPYLSFPINDERKTGFLAPGFGSDEESGTVFELPWYWNIAKNQDATITARNFSDRGLQVGAEYRRKSLTSSTYLFGEVLPDDELFGDDRDLLMVRHTQYLGENFVAAINYNDVSDVDYFEDLRSDVRFFSASYVPRDVSLKYTSKYVKVYARANEYQIIDPNISESSKPYERLPSLNLSTSLPDGPLGMRYGLNASYTDFASDTKVEGTRVGLSPYAYIPFKNIWGFVTPKVTLHNRSYSLDNIAAGSEDSPSFTVPVFSIDAGVYFEKNTKWFGDSALQTLEPRVFYAYAPDEDQSDVPIFDTSQVSFNNFGNIFRENRFYGEDRVGDTNQVTVGVTTRIIDNKTGDERFKASFGQLYLLDDLQQNLFSSQPVEKGLGDFLAEIQSESEAGLTTYGFIQYDHEDNDIQTARFAVGYAPNDDNRKKLSVGYYYAKGFFKNVDQLTLNAHWPISDRWQFLVDERYSLEDSESISTTIGLEYNACCWKLRFTGQERINNYTLEDKNTSFFVELELTSLGSIRTGL